MKILFVDDEDSQREMFKDTVDRINDVDGLLLECEVAASIVSAEKLGYSSFDVAVVDLDLDKSGGIKGVSDGSALVDYLNEGLFRIPVIVWSALPGGYEKQGMVVHVFNKGEDSMDEVVALAQKIVKTGLTSLVGRKGAFEEKLSNVVSSAVIPNLGAWMDRLEGDTNTKNIEESLTRFVLSHFMDACGKEAELSFGEEFYLFGDGGLSTGEIIRFRGEQRGRDFIIINPSCDLVDRPGTGIKAESLYLLPIMPREEALSLAKGEAGIKKQAGLSLKLMKNNHELSAAGHWLPTAVFYDGGFACFRDLQTISTSDLANFDFIGLRVAPGFINNLQDRFSSFLSRQGQPDICYKRDV